MTSLYGRISEIFGNDVVKEGDITDAIAVDNIICLANRSEKYITKFLKQRFLNNQYYSWLGPALLSINPLSINEGCSPNVSDITDKVWYRTVHAIGKNHQVIVISGDSGAGKTFTANLALNSIIKQHSDLRDRITKALPLLSVFGNACTIHNSNSSRFGMLLKLQFRDLTINGAHIETYMLEKSRVSEPHSNEGNFHIFQQLLEDLGEKELSDIHLSKKTRYKVAPRLNMSQKLSSTVDTLQAFKITNSHAIFSVLSAILNLGNVEFKQECEHFEISSETKIYLLNACRALEIDSNQLVAVLTARTIVCKPQGKRKSHYSFPCENKEDCEDRRNVLMRFLYAKLFLWLVEAINRELGKKDLSGQRIGILDLYGFEILNVNSLEQLCINYANERLQYHFIREFFDDSSMDFHYSQRINVLDGSPSVFSIINEESILNRHNRDIFVTLRLAQELKHCSQFWPSKSEKSVTFSIRHYAGLVKYNTRKVVAKNRDRAPKEIIQCLNESKCLFLKEIIGENENKGSILDKFKASLDNLMKTLDEADVHYVKCLKPNYCQKPNCVDENFLSQQLRVNGIFDVMSAMMEKYPFRFSISEFENCYGTDMLNVLKNIFRSDVYEDGVSINMAQPCFDLLKRLEALKMSYMARKLQRRWREKFRRRQRAAVTIQRFFRSHLGNTRKDAGDAKVFSSALERTLLELGSFKFKRGLFYGNKVVSRMRIAQIPVRIHLRRTCIPYSHVLPRSEMPNGLSDIF